MILRPTFIMPYGINKGHALSEIYQYKPEYIEWLIEYVPEFEIEISDFENLPNPTIIVNERPKGNSLSDILQAGIRSLDWNSVEKIKQKENLKEVAYRFSDKIKKILNEKIQGSYQCPEWNRSKVILSIPIEKLSDFLKNKLH
jgi:hypothetical protein